jgi:hypothetical protein
LETVATLPQFVIAIADPAQCQIQGVNIRRKSLGFAHVDHLSGEKLGQVLVEALAAGLAVSYAGF